MRKTIKSVMLCLMALCLLCLCACEGKSEPSEVLPIAACAPVIRPQKNVMYGVKGKPLALCGATASDGERDLPVTKTLSFGETVIPADGSFTPEHAGTYTLTFAATANGRTTQKTVDIYVEESEKEYADKITSFDKPFGVQQCGLAYGYLDYSTDVKFGDEAGSLKLSMRTRRLNTNLEMTWHNLDTADWSEFEAILFYAYNSSDSPVTLRLGFYTNSLLMPKSWTPVYLMRSDLYAAIKRSGYPSVATYMNTDDCNGFHATIQWGTDNLVRGDDAVYFSAVRGVRTMTLAQIEGKMNDETLSESEKQALDFYCTKILSRKERKELSGYAQYATARQAAFLERAGITPVAGRAVYFNDKAGCAIKTYDSIKATFSFTDTVTYNGEGTLGVRMRGGSDLAFLLNMPYPAYIGDGTTVKLRVYYTGANDLRLNNKSGWAKAIGQGSKQYFDLQPNAWNEVDLPVGNAEDLWGAHIIIQRKGSDITIPEDARIYIAPIDVIG